MSEKTCVYTRIQPLAEALGIKRKTYLKWKERKSIPARRHLSLLQEAKRQEMPLTHEELFQ